MAAKKNPLSDKAYQMYKQGMKLVDIATELNVPPGTVRRWKNNQNWDGERSESKANDKSERSGSVSWGNMNGAKRERNIRKASNKKPWRNPQIRMQTVLHGSWR